jgi:hypothetical protein
MFEVHQVKVHIWDPKILGLNHVWSISSKSALWDPKILGLNYVWGTSSENAHLGSQNFGIEPCLRYIKRKCIFGIPNAHFHLMYLKHGSIIGLMVTPWVETCRHFNWQYISCVLTELSVGILRLYSAPHIKRNWANFSS